MFYSASWGECACGVRQQRTVHAECRCSALGMSVRVTPATFTSVWCSRSDTVCPPGGGSYGWFLSGVFYVSSATRRRRTIVNSRCECSEVEGGVVITIGAVTARIAGEHPNIQR